MQVVRLTGGIQLYVQHLLRDGAPLAAPRATGVLQGVLQVEQHAQCRARHQVVTEHGRRYWSDKLIMRILAHLKTFAWCATASLPMPFDTIPRSLSCCTCSSV